MEKIYSRKVRIEIGPQIAHNSGMDEDTLGNLLAHATELTYQSFEEVSDEHIEWVYMRLISNYRWGLGDTGATTVH